ncbi:MAG: metallophosphoesterase [Planctomycetota bacterium]|nr:metallophosphoesterase [Planctomycetota bacterium]
MIIGVMSDSHDNLTRISAVLEAFRANKCEAILHLGDFVAPFALKAILQFGGGPVHAVYGNNDGERAGLSKLLPTLRQGPVTVEIGGRKIGMAHERSRIPDEYFRSCDVVLFGHSHDVHVEPYGKNSPLVLNPGETCGWLTGKATCAIVNLDSMEAAVIETGS